VSAADRRYWLIEDGASTSHMVAPSITAVIEFLGRTGIIFEESMLIISELKEDQASLLFVRDDDDARRRFPLSEAPTGAYYSTEW